MDDESDYEYMRRNDEELYRAGVEDERKRIREEVGVWLAAYVSGPAGCDLFVWKEDLRAAIDRVCPARG